MIFQLLPSSVEFPDTALAEEDGLLAIGGDLSTDRLIEAYSNGIFPWYSDTDPICWFSPHQRCVILPNKIKVSKSMKTLLNGNSFTITFDKAFAEVIKECATANRPGQDGTWINEDMQAAYIALHKKGYAHSVEVWKKGVLAGGLYGVAINRVFCGESMFSTQSNASKAALIWLCQNKRYQLIDCQIPNDHLMSLGAEMIDRSMYLNYLKEE